MNRIDSNTLRALAHIFCSDPTTLHIIGQALADLADRVESLSNSASKSREELEALIWYSVEVYEREYLWIKHRRRQVAGRTRQTLLKHRTAREGLIELIANRKESTGLTAMADIGRLNLSFEQIIIDNAEHFPPELVTKARTNLLAAAGRR